MKPIEFWGICTDYYEQDDVYRITLQDEQGQSYFVSVCDYECHCDVEIGRHYYTKGVDASESMGRPAIFADYVDQWGRYCDHCGRHHEEGYYDESMGVYICSDECLHELYTEDEINALQADEDDLVLYWTEWYN